MSKLTYGQRKKLPTSKFAIHHDGLKKYPIEDISHARNALARVSAYGSPHEKAMVRKKVKKRYPSIDCVKCSTGFGMHTH